MTNLKKQEGTKRRLVVINKIKKTEGKAETNLDLLIFLGADIFRAPFQYDEPKIRKEQKRMLVVINKIKKIEK